MNSSVNDFKIEKFVYIIIMTIAFTTQYGEFLLPSFVQYFLALIVIIFGFFNFLVGKNKNNKNLTLKNMFSMYLLPAILIHLYSIFMIMIGKIDKSFLCTNISSYIPILTAMFSIYIFGKDALKLTLTSLILSWLISFGFAIIDRGIGVIPFAIMQGYFDNTTPILGVSHNYLEFHDIVLSFGLPVIYFIFKKDKFSKKDIMFVLVCIIIMGLGIKRISVLGLLVSFIFIKYTRNKSINKINICKNIVGIGLFILSFAFIFSLYNKDIMLKITSTVNVMGRNYYYDAIKQYGEFSISFLGVGRNSVTQILTQKYAYLRVGGVHSDILKMYIENGFIVFALWMFYYLFRLPKKIAKNFNFKTMILYISVIIYTFILFFTDNVENYFIYQIFFCMVPVSYYLNTKVISGGDSNE